jgi:lipoprotein-releasing system permease protein
MRADVFLALKFLREGRVQSSLLVVGTTIGVTVVFFVTALIAAVESTMISQTLDVLPHVVLRRSEEIARPTLTPGTAIFLEQVHEPAQKQRSLQDWQPLLRYARHLAEIEAVSATASGPAVARKGEAMRTARLLGIEPRDFARVIAIERRVTRGTFDVSSDSALVGVELAGDLGLEVGARFHLVGTDGHQDSFRVAGVFDMGNADVNRSWVLTSLRAAQSLLDLPGGVSTLDVRLRDIWQADAVAAHLGLHTGVAVDSWMQTNSQLMVAIQSQRGATLIIRTFIMLAVAMGIASVLIVSVVQKSRQVGILRAMGMQRTSILKVFLLQGALVGLLGACLGCGLGTLLCFASEGSNTTPQGTPMYPIQLPVSLYVLCAVIALGTALLAAALPARQAAVLEPAEAIRHD